MQFTQREQLLIASLKKIAGARKKKYQKRKNPFCEEWEKKNPRKLKNWFVPHQISWVEYIPTPEAVEAMDALDLVGVEYEKPEDSEVSRQRAYADPSVRQPRRWNMGNARW